MKTSIRNTKALATLVSAVLVVVSTSHLSRSSESAQAVNPATPSTPIATNGPPVQVVPPAPVNLPPQLAEVARLVQAGVGEDVILGYVEKSATAYPVTADQIVYLRDLGLSSRVLTALVGHNAAATSDAEAVASETAPPATSAPAPASSATAPATVVNNNYYDSLAPYGTWMNMPGYGWCWQPTVAVSNPDWQPYGNDGNWLWSDCGWYWNSSYSWGWAPFHYGRWCQYPNYGWLWRPDNVWGPAWVSWRNWGDYCGWAPLPWGAGFTAGIGWTWNGIGVGFNCGFGLPWSHFNFVHHRDFGDRHWFHHRLGGHEARNAFDRSQVANRYHFDPAHGIVNHGVDPNRIAAATHSKLRQVAIRDLPGGTRQAGPPGRLARAGDSSVVYRPGANTAVRRDPTLATLNSPRQFGGAVRSGMAIGSPNTRAEVSRGAGVMSSGRAVPSFGGRSGPFTAGGARSVSPTPGGTARSGLQATHNWSAPAPRAPTASSRSFSYTPTVRSAPSPSYSWRSAPSWSGARPSNSRPGYSAPAFRSWSAPSRSFAMPSRSFSAPSFSGRSFSSPSYRAPSFSGHSSSFGGGGGGGTRGSGGRR